MTEDLLEFSEVKSRIGQYAKTPLGEAKVKSLSPLLEYSQLQKALEEVGEMMLLLKGGQEFGLSGLKDVRKALAEVREQGRVLEPTELLDVAELLSTARALKRTLLRLDRKPFPRLRDLASQLPDQIPLEEKIHTAISSQEEVLDTASPKLARIRRKKRDVEERIRGIFDRLLRSPRIRKALQTDRPVLRGDRLCLAVKIGFARTIRGMVLDSSATGQTVFIEPEQVVRWGNRLAEYSSSERNEINSILRRLTLEVLRWEETLLEVQEVLTHLDSLQSRAKWGLHWGHTVPQVREGRHLKLREARHPLLLELYAEQGLSPEEAKGKVVPFDLSLSQEERALVISGPNAGGKTVLLKAIGLLSLMGQSGIPIPAEEGATIPLYRKIFLSIGDEQNIFSALSTFSASMVKLKDILENLSPQVLVLLDEIGAGTDPDEAGALACAIFEEILRSGAHTVVTTHLSRLKRFAFGRREVISASMEFDSQTLLPTYRLHLGIPGDSHALAIAQKVGLPKELIEKAESYLHKSEEKEWLQRLGEEVHKVRVLREQAEEWEREAKEFHSRLSREVEDLERRKRLLEGEVERELETFRRNLLLHLSGILKKVYPHSSRQQIEAVEEELLALLGSTSLGEKRRQFFQSLKKGKPVFVLSLAREGVVTRIHKAKGTLRVKIDQREVETCWEDVSPLTLPIATLTVQKGLDHGGQTPSAG